MPYRHLLASLVLGSLGSVLSLVPLAAETRTWTDSSGKHKIEADFKEIVEGQVKLERPDGKKVSLPLSKLCKDDQAYLKDLMKRRRSGDADEGSPFEEEMDESYDGETEEDDIPGIGGYRIGDRVEVRDGAKWSVGKVVGFEHKWKHIQVRLEETGAIKEAWEGDHWIRRYDARAAAKAASAVAGGGKRVKPRPGDWSGVNRVVDLGGDGSFEPDPAVESPAARPRSLTLGKSPGFFSQLLPAAFGPPANSFIAFGTAGQGEINDSNSTIEICDFNSGRVLQKVPGPRDLALTAVSPDGKRLATISASEPFKHGPVQIWNVQGKQLDYASGWEASQGDRVAFKWLCWIDDDHLMTLEDDVLTLWNVDGAEAVYLVSGDRLGVPTFSPGGNQFVIAASGRVSVHDVKSGDMLQNIPLDGRGHARSAAFSPSGKLLAVTAADEVIVYDATNGEKVTQAYAPGSGFPNRGVAWANEKQVLVGGTNLVDVGSQMAIWTYVHQASQVVPAADGRVWFTIVDQHQGRRALLPLKLPHAGVKPVSEGDLILKPGDAMGLELQVDDPAMAAEVEPQLKAAIEQAGFKFKQDAPAKLVARSGHGQSEEITYQDWGIKRTEHKMNVALREYEVKFVVNGEDVWKRLNVQRPPHIVRLQKDESVQQAVDREMQPNAGMLLGSLPSRVLPLQAAEARASQITINGLK